MSVPMALVDFIPVFLFIWAAVVLQRTLYEQASKGAFALFSAGTIMVGCAGFLKALWKLLYTANICDFERLSQCFFPMQALGFLLAGIAAAAILFFKQKKDTAAYAAGAPAVFAGTFIFVAMMVLGALGLCGGMAVEAGRRGKKKAVPLFILAFVCLMGMGYLSSKDFA